MLLAVGLYLLQIALFSYVFVRNWTLGIVGLSQMIAYAATVVVVGIVVFQERISLSWRGAGFSLHRCCTYESLVSCSAMHVTLSS